MTQPFIVTLPEAGQKLFQYLCRKLNTPKVILHRWIRTGQVRVNGKRTQPFAHISFKDIIRIPPSAKNDIKNHELYSVSNKVSIKKQQTEDYPFPTIIEETSDLLVISKPAGLPTHGGTGHTDSVVHRISIHYADSHFMPTPIHRLDKDTTGLLLIAKNYTTLKKLSSHFAQHAVQKEYLAWVTGLCPWNKPIYLNDTLITTSLNKKKHILCDTQNNIDLVPIKTKNACLSVRCIKQKSNYSLLHIRLYTGRTHQIRAQLSARNHPIVGDNKYGQLRTTEKIKLHAFRVTIDNIIYEDKPLWNRPWSIESLKIPKLHPQTI